QLPRQDGFFQLLGDPGNVIVARHRFHRRSRPGLADRGGVKVLLRPGVPDLHRLVRARGRQAPVVWAESHTVDALGVALKGQRLLPRDDVPEFGRLVVRAARQARAIGAEGDAVDLARVALQYPKLLAVGRVPDAHGLVKGGAGQALAVTAEGDA